MQWYTYTKNEQTKVTYNVDKLQIWWVKGTKLKMYMHILFPSTSIQFTNKGTTLGLGKTNNWFLYGKDKIKHGEFSSMWKIIRKLMMMILSAEGSDEGWTWMWKYWGGNIRLCWVLVLRRNVGYLVWGRRTLPFILALS